MNPSRILIVEDQPALAAMVQQWLEKEGYECEVAGDGITALKKILSTSYALILLDLKIPGLHGVELLRKLRASSRTDALPVLVMSGAYKGEDHKRALRELGVPLFLEKPFNPVQLAAAVRKLLPATQPVSDLPQTTSSPAAKFDRHLSQAFLRSFSGELILNDGTVQRHLLFVNGAPVSLRPGFIHRNFGDFLLRQGTITAEEYDFYAHSGEYRHDLLVQMGCLHYHQLLEQKFSYLTQELLAGFSAPPMTAELRSLLLPPGIQVISVNVAEIILNGYRATLTPEQKASCLTTISNRYLARTATYFRYINSLHLNDAECAFLNRLDGKECISPEIQRESELSPLIYLLHAFGMVRFSAAASAAAEPVWPLRLLFNSSAPDIPGSAGWEEMENFADLLERPKKSETAATPMTDEAPAPDTAQTPPQATSDSSVSQTFARMQGQNYYQVLGLTPGSFSFNKLKESYFAISKEFGPDLLMRLGGEEAAQAESILSLVANAYETLSDVVKKEKYDQLLGSEKIGLGQRGDDRFHAKVQAQSGKVFIEMEEWDNAEKALKDASAIEPDNGDTLAHLAWAIYRNPQYATSRPTLDRARQMLNRAITMERTAPAFAFKGWILLDNGQESLAESEFNKALKIDARNMLARKGLRQILEKREQEKKGLFGRMFGG